MIMSPKKKLATVILGKMTQNKEVPETEDFVQRIGEVEETIVEVNPTVEDDSMALESAAEDMMDAIKKEDPKMFLEAFMNLIDLVEESEEQEEE